MIHKVPEFADFQTAAATSDMVALCTPVAFDHETAVTLADRFVDEPYFFLLESAASGPNSRYSFLGFDPIWTWSIHDCASGTAEFNEYSEDTKTVITQHITAKNPIIALREVMKKWQVITAYPKGIRLGGPDTAAMLGATGFFGFDVGQALEPSIGKPPPKSLGVPDAAFFLPRQFLVVDHLSRRLFVGRNVPVPTSERGETALRKLYDQEIAALRQQLSRLEQPHRCPTLDLVEAPLDFQRFDAVLTESEFLTLGKRCLEAVKAGEVFQIQISNRLSCDTGARPFDIFRHLRMLNPSPYMFFYKWGEHHLVGASPEMMVGVQARQITHRPIAGTRRRTWEPERDATMRSELVESEKERAEHVMLVDLARNDIGRIAAPGTVRVEELMTVEEYSHVFHMVSQVVGTLPPDKDAYDAMQVSFPNGTVSGAPKIRAMQLIYEMEKVGREFYAGSLGMFDSQGNLRSTLLIRTIHVANGRASTQAAAGFVYDSIPEQEWLETRNKMAACLLAIQNIT